MELLGNVVNVVPLITGISCIAMALIEGCAAPARSHRHRRARCSAPARR